MSYIKQTHVDGKALHAEHLNHMEEGIAQAVSYAGQDLTDDQKAQARENIGALGDEIMQMEYSPNLLDSSAILENSLLLYTGGVLYSGTSYANYVTSGYIPCQPGDVIRYQFTYNGVRYDCTEKPEYTLMYAICGYDENGDFVSNSGVRNVSVYTVPSGVASIRISFFANSFNVGNVSDSAIIIQDEATVLPFTEYGTVVSQTVKPEMLPSSYDPLLAFLPDEICVAVGRTIEIYNSQVCPLAEKCHFRWVCSVGKALKRKFSITGTDALIGEYHLELEIYNDKLDIVWSGASTLKIVSDALSSEIDLCSIGDSLTNGKYWLNELRTLSANKIVNVGTRGTTDGLKHEGRSGFTSSSYLSATAYTYEGEDVHPFWDPTNECFSWAYYKESTGINPTAVQIFLGTNDLFGNITAETFTANIKAMVDSIRDNDSTIPIFVALTILPGNQNGIGVQQSTDGFASYVGKCKYALDCKYIEALQTLYDALKSYTGLYFVPLTECHDNEYNFGAVETSVNPRAPQTEYMPSEGVHPQQQGYEQMADVMYSAICGALA